MAVRGATVRAVTRSVGRTVAARRPCAPSLPAAHQSSYACCWRGFRSGSGGGADERCADWGTVYAQADARSLPWYSHELDADVERGLAACGVLLPDGAPQRPGGAPPPHVLDVGAGAGTQATALARRGLRVTATDLSDEALAQARQLPGAEAVRWLRDDILDTRLLDSPPVHFDAVVDRGCLHVLRPEARKRYAVVMWTLLRAEGVLLLKTFSELEPDAGRGPYRFGPALVRSVFEPLFVLDSAVESTFAGRQPPPHALFCVLRKRPPQA